MTLSIVYPPKVIRTSPAIYIAAVRGLGDAINTRTDPKRKAFWLRNTWSRVIRCECTAWAAKREKE
ncbi:hypothetical protein A1O7_09617 [Cladophialophora yegresii CBS 114405]|uniref:Uncharacterized protein n=1 Tax=Cladophialophora yegresii CBS 114405 TaxID=1182544 RepID=W9W6V8_9EURO|nr:uncharacterized protein A1O7_09617 [Cladophialophora yegresii CBS 114405]EXJ54279.1 hypothetical protein A1O7_09617 [Cladophialophora yegresii CBS 114405]